MVAPPPRLGAPKSYLEVLHAQKEKRHHRARGGCGRHLGVLREMARQLDSKWNGREFAASFGATLPALHRRGRGTRALTRRGLPGRFVIRPERGSASRGVLIVVDGRELWRDEAIPPPEAFGA